MQCEAAGKGEGVGLGWGLVIRFLSFVVVLFGVLFWGGWGGVDGGLGVDGVEGVVDVYSESCCVSWAGSLSSVGSRGLARFKAGIYN